MSEFNDWNRKTIDEFRANGGKVGGMFDGKTLLLLHTKGAKSRQERINPVAYVRDGERFVVIASKGGAPTNPDWYYNVVATPDLTVEVGTETFRVHAMVAEGAMGDLPAGSDTPGSRHLSILSVTVFIANRRVNGAGVDAMSVLGFHGALILSTVLPSKRHTQQSQSQR